MPHWGAHLAHAPLSRRWLTLLSAAAGLVAGAVFWVGHAAFDALYMRDESFRTALIAPSEDEIFSGVVFAIAAAVVAWYFGRAIDARARLFVFRRAVDEADDGIQLTDPEGRVVYSNPAVERLYGFSVEELKGRHVDAMNADPTFASREILPSLFQRGRWEGEVDVRHRDGHVFPIWLVASVVRAGGEVIAMIGVIRDITDRKRAEAELRSYAERLERANQLQELFADIMRHDILNPASVVKQGAELLMRQEDDPRNRRVLERVLSGAGRIIDLTESAARYARLSLVQELEVEALDVCELWRTAIRELSVQAQARGARVELHAPERCEAWVHPMLAEVFANLLSNAIKYGPPEGRIEVAIEEGARTWRCAVRDHGAGIPDADKERIFARFERADVTSASVKGTGLGLAIAKRIVELHAGRIWVEDNPGGGSVFVVEVPQEGGRTLHPPGAFPEPPPVSPTVH